jgi:hypothetical protein
MKDGRNLILTTKKIKTKNRISFYKYLVFTTNQYFVYEKNYSDVFITVSFSFNYAITA